MSRRVVALVLGAALTSGLVIGVAGAKVGVADLVRVLGVAVPPRSDSGHSTVELAPPLVMRQFTFTGERPGGSGRRTVTVHVPDGWREIVKAELWRDFHDPSEELNLRLRADLPGKSMEDAAAAHRAKNSGLPGYQELGSGWVELSSELAPVYELRFSYTDKGRTRYVIETFFGDSDVFLVGGYHWEGQEDRLREPIVEVVRTFGYEDER